MIELQGNNLFLKTNNECVSILNGEGISFSYTLKTDDIRKLGRSSLTPYNSRKNNFESCKDVLLNTREMDEGLEITINLQSNLYSEWGINLPLNFMGKKDGGSYKNQYLFNSPYKDSSCENNFLYLTNPNGHNLLIVLKTEYTYWKMDYSTFCGGHFFSNLKLLCQLDKAYDPINQNRKEFVFLIKEVKNYKDALDEVAKYLNKPILSYDLSGGCLNTQIIINVHGKADCVSDGINEIKIENTSFKYTINKEGRIYLVPFYKGKKGLECSIYGYKNIENLYNKSIKSIDFNDIAATDGNLCEHQCYVSATLRYLLRYGKNEEYEEIAKKALSVICETDPLKAQKRITILDKPQQNGYPAYHLFESNRIQEQFFGVTILLDAYKYFKDEKYLRYAINALNTMIDYYQKDDGGFYAKMPWNETFDDYSTVTCLIIPIIDMALFLKDLDSKNAQKFELSAKKLAKHVFDRGFNFATETIIGDEHEPEMEDGSISCSALTLLYFYNMIEQREEYLNRAKEILDLHECWVVNTPLCNSYRSSLRWWETNWEGDSDGPSLCLGHAWTIWRAEADFWLFKATGDNNYLLKSINSFNSNFAKIQDNGKSYSASCLDYISGGGFEGRKQLVYRISPEFPDQTDSGLSRYVWIRANDTIINFLK